MKRFLAIILGITLAFSIVSCKKADNKGKKDQDESSADSPVTMFVAMGNTESYYRALAEKIEQELGIEVEFVYNVSCDTTNMTKLYFANNDLPADIVFTAAKLDNDLLKDSCLDLMGNSSVTTYFTKKTIEDVETEDGAVYQLPISSRLIGITYNETLLNEMGWEVPETFQDMVDLKAKCDEAGIKFAVTDGVATGHGFNWLFHLMGSQWLSTLDGTKWFENFLAGKATIDEFKDQCEYFKKWTEAGLWGSFHNADWNGSTEFSKTRALFWFGLVNTATGYEGPEYDDEGNETGKMLNDTYKTIPWISENGDNNCYTTYDNCWVYVNKKLGNAENSEKLKKVLKILEYMASNSDAENLVTDMSKDTYISVNNYTVSEDRLYSAYMDEIKNGFVQPWYYNYFDADSIAYTGEKINAYIAGTGSFDDIFTELQSQVQKTIDKEIEVLAEFPESFDYEETAKLVAISTGEALNATLEANGSAERATVVIAPYTEEANGLQPWKGNGICNSVIYKGTFDASYYNTIFASGAINPIGIYMTGAEIKEIVKSGFDPSDKYIDAATGESTFDSENYGPYPYVCVVKGGAELVDDQTYLVALCQSYLTNARYNEFSEAGKVITGLENILQLKDGLFIFAETRDTITKADLAW